MSVVYPQEMFKYLKEESYYTDLYDLHTIEECLRFCESQRNQFPQTFGLYFIKGERYRNKSSTVRKWMERDHECNEFFLNVQEPHAIRCSNCARTMSVIEKELYDFLNKHFRVLFFFECPACKKRKGIFDNGEEYKPKSSLCPKCNRVIKVSAEQKEKTLIWSENCPSCGFTETQVDDVEKERTERIEKEQKQIELLHKHRVEFCFSDKEGFEYVQGIERIKTLEELVKKSELKQMDPDYKKAESLNKWTIAQLEKALSETLKKEQYLKLSFEKPEIDRYVIVPFTVQDFDSSRKEKDSEYKLRRVIKKALERSNWRLMSEGVFYRLGYLSGRLKGYEREEDLVQIIREEKLKVS